MDQFIPILRLVAVLVAACLVGNWFLAEVKKQQSRGLPTYRVFATPPGLLVIAAAIALPIAFWLLKK